MLSVISGKQRAGKSFYVVTLMVEYLRDSDRPIFTNLPINPDFLCRYAAGRRSGRFHDYLDRIYVFKDKSLSELKYFYRKNPQYCKRCFGNIISDEKLKRFWEVTKPNSLIFFDEVYEIFSCLGYKDSGAGEDRKRLLSYTRQHGHRKDDLYLISHNLADLDAFIRRGTQYLYVIRNSKYTNIFKAHFMRGLKWPVQFFIIEGFEFGESEPSDRWTLWPDKRVFKCYNSFSGCKLVGKHSVSDDASSTDTGVPILRNFKLFIRQFWPWALFGVGVVVALYVVVKGIRRMVNMSSSTVSSGLINKKKGVSNGKSIDSDSSSGRSSDVASSGSGSVSGEKTSSFGPEKVKIERPHVVGVTPNMVVWSDGYKLRLGDVIKRWKVEKITNHFVYFSCGKRRVRVVLSGARLYYDNPRTGD